MPVSDIDPRALRKMTPQQVADLALAADQESRRLAKAGDAAGAAHWDNASARLLATLNPETVR